MAGLALFLFGAPHIEREARKVSVDTRKAIALLAYLALTQQNHQRDTLVTLLWPDYDQAHARATLRRTLSSLNKALDGPWLHIERETIGLDQKAAIWIDVKEFQEQLSIYRAQPKAHADAYQDYLKPLTKAVALYKNGFMAGFHLQDSNNFEDWQAYYTDSLRRDFTYALENLIHCYSMLASYETAIVYARRLLSLDHLHEVAHRYLMKLYALTGHRAAAIHQYEECVSILHQELGVKPLENTTRIYEAIKNNQPISWSLTSESISWHHRQPEHTYTSTSPQSPIIVPPAPNEYPFVGRSEEWVYMLQAYEHSKTQGHVIVLCGEAGIGKTRLAEEFLAHVTRQDIPTIRAHCYEGESDLAFSPISTGLRMALAQQGTNGLTRIADHWLSEASRLLPELTTFDPDRPLQPSFERPGSQNHFLEGIRQVYLALVSGHDTRPPGIIFIDDLHWADSSTIDLLTYFMRRIHENKICLLLTWRQTQFMINSRLQSVLKEMEYLGRATIITLSRFDQLIIEQLCQQTPPTQKLNPALIKRLYQESEGLPFLLTEYLTAITTGIIKVDDSIWSVPHGMRNLLLSRINAVGDTSRQLLGAASTIGRSFDFDTLREVSGRSEEETITALEELITHGLIQERQKVRAWSDNADIYTLMYDFSHEKLRTLAYEETSQTRLRLLHKRLAEILVTQEKAHGDTSMLAGKIAHHYQSAGEIPIAANYYCQAGEYASSLSAHTEAIQHFLTALALEHPDTYHLHERLGEQYTLLGEYGQALHHYHNALQQEGRSQARVHHQMGRVYERRGEWAQAEEHFRTALAGTQKLNDVSEQAHVFVDWSLATHHQGLTDQALIYAQQALVLAEHAQDAYALAQSHNMLGILANNQQNPEQALQHLKQSLALAKRLGDSVIHAAVLNNLALVYKAQGTFEQAQEAFRAALQLCISQGDRHREAAIHNNLADLLHLQGQRDAAMAHLKRAVTIYAEIGIEAGTIQPEIWKLTEW